MNIGMQKVFLVLGTLLPLAYGCFVAWSIFRLYKSRLRRRGRQNKVGRIVYTSFLPVMLDIICMHMMLKGANDVLSQQPLFVRDFFLSMMLRQML